MRTLSFVVMVGLFGLIRSSPVGAADAAPTLSTTTTWLSESLPTFSNGYDATTSITDSLTYTFSDCNLIITDDKRYGDSIGADSNATVYSLEFQPRSGIWWDASGTDVTGSDLNGAKEGVNSSIILNLKTVNLTSISVKNHTIGVSDILAFEAINLAPRLVRLSTGDESLANRLTKAFKHAASLCGAGSDPF